MAVPLMERTPVKIPRPEPVRETGRWLLAAGAATLLLGVAALFMSVQTTFLTVIVLGWWSLIASVFQAVFALTGRRREGTGLHLLLAVLYGAVGLYLVSKPLAGAAALTLALGVLFVASGALRIAGAAAGRFAGWGWTFFSGLVAAALGLYVLRNLPDVSLLLLGTLFGVDMIFLGGGLVGLGLVLRRA